MANNYKHKIVQDFLKHVLVLDTESTGIDPLLAEICEIGTFHEAESYPNQWVSRLFGTIEPIPFMATAKNNISRRMLQDKPKFGECIEKDVISMLQLDNNDFEYYCAHNYQYDKKLLTTQLNKLSFADNLKPKFDKKKWICTFRVTRHLFKGLESYSQNYLRYYFDLPGEDLTIHRAWDDCRVCIELLKHICYYIVQNLEGIDESFNLGKFLVDLTQEPIEVENMVFGKHKGQPIKTLPDSYLKWLIVNSDSLKEESPNYDSDFAAAIINEMNKRELAA